MKDAAPTYWIRCSDCGERMVERTNSLTGEALLGCSQYPECRETQPLPEHIKLRRRGAIPLPGME